MILVGNQRGGARDLALHLMKDENEHVAVHELRGFAAQTLMGALTEAYAVSRGTRCRQFLYSLSLNPPPRERVPVAAFEAAIERAERRLGLSGQPRAVVFHEKEGRRHAHVVWSRIDVSRMKAVQMSHDHDRLQAVSRELFLEHGWTMPEGLARSEGRDPRTFTLAQWQQARRADKDPRAVKTAFAEAWAISDSGPAFVHALAERGYRVARGDRRGFVAVDVQGEVYAIPKWAGLKTRQVRDRLGDEAALPGIAEVKRRLADEMLPRLGAFRDQLEAEAREQRAAFDQRRRDLVRRQRAERQSLKDRTERRSAAEAAARQARFRTGLGGLWDRLRGEHGRIRERNEREAEAARLRDRAERDALVFRHLDQRQRLTIFRLHVRQRHDEDRRALARDMDAFRAMRLPDHDPPAPRRPRRSRGPVPEL